MISRSIVERMGGSLTIASTPGVGTTATISLRVAERSVFVAVAHLKTSSSIVPTDLIMISFGVHFPSIRNCVNIGIGTSAAGMMPTAVSSCFAICVARNPPDTPPYDTMPAALYFHSCCR